MLDPSCLILLLPIKVPKIAECVAGAEPQTTTRQILAANGISMEISGDFEAGVVDLCVGRSMAQVVIQNCYPTCAKALLATPPVPRVGYPWFQPQPLSRCKLPAVT